MSPSTPRLGASVPHLTFHVALEASRLLRARERIRDYLRVHCEDERLMDEVVLCIEEACTNAIRHSGARDDMLISMGFDERDLCVEVRDHGTGFDVAAFDPGVTPDIESTGGRGLYLIAHLMDELDLQANGGVEVRMLKRAALRPRATGPAVDAALGDRPHEAGARVRAMLEEIDEAFLALDWEYRLVHGNRAAIRLAGGELPDRTPWDAFGGQDRELEQACRDAMELGRPAVLEYQHASDGRWLEARVYPTSAGVSLYFRDIDARKRRELERDDYLAALRDSEARYKALSDNLRERTEELGERVRLAEALAAVDQLAHSAHGIDVVVERALREGMRGLDAGAAAVELRESGTWFVRYQLGLTPETLGMRLTDAEAPMATRVRETGEALVVPDMAKEPLFDVGFVRQYSIKASIAVPLIARGATVGCLLFHHSSPHGFDQAEIDFVRKLGSSVSLAMENARLAERQDESARLSASLSEGALGRFVTRYRERPLHVLVGASVVEAVYLMLIGHLTPVRQVLGLPGSLMALTVVVAAALAGPLVGVAAAAFGGVIYWMVVADFGDHSSLVATSVSTAIWIASAVLAGLMAEALRTQAEKRRSASVALARAVAAREAQTAEQRRVEALAADLHAEREQLRTIVEEADYGIVLLDRDFTYLLVNSSYAASCGYARDEMVGLNHFDLYPNEENEAVFRRVLETGEPFEASARPYHPPKPELAVTYWDWRVTPTRDGQGRVEGLVFSLTDVTGRVRAQRLSETLNAVGAVMSEGFEPERTIRTALQLTGEALGYSAGALVARSGESWVAAYLWNMPEELSGGALDRAELSCTERAIAEGRPLLDCAAGDHDVRVFSRRIMPLAGTIPLSPGGHDVAALVFAGEGSPRERDPAEFEFAKDVAATISQALENARLFEEQRRLATTLQENLLHPLPAIPGMEFGRVSHAAHEPELVGGDFSDVFAIDDSTVAVLIGDVAGKGVRAAGLTETVHTAVSSFALVEPSPAYVLRKTNELLLSRGDDDQFVTAFLAIIDRRTGETSFSSAGHPPPVVVGPASADALDVPYGVPLGSFAVEYPVARTVLQTGECLVLYTDGVIEARRGGELFGRLRLLDALRPLGGYGAQEVAKRLRDEAATFADRLRDDLLVLTVRLTGPLHDQPLRLGD